MTQEKISGTERTLQRDNFLAIINAFPMENLEKGTENANMVSWQIQNDVIECLSELVWSKIKDEIPDYYAIIAYEVTDRFSTKKIYDFVFLM